MVNYVKLNESFVKDWYHKRNPIKRKDIATSNTNIIAFKIKCKDCGRVHTVNNKPASTITLGFTCPNEKCGRSVQGTYNHYRNIPPSVQRHVRKRDKSKCVYCGRRGSKNNPIEWGHHIPHSGGGCTCAQNIQLECKQCNRRKTENWVIDTNKTVKGCRKKCFNKLKTNFSKQKHKKKYRREKINKKYYGLKLADLLEEFDE